MLFCADVFGGVRDWFEGPGFDGVLGGLVDLVTRVEVREEDLVGEVGDLDEDPLLEVRRRLLRFAPVLGL